MILVKWQQVFILLTCCMDDPTLKLIFMLCIFIKMDFMCLHSRFFNEWLHKGVSVSFLCVVKIDGKIARQEERHDVI